MKKGKQIQWGEAVNRNSTDLPHALHLATGSGNGFEGAFDKIPGGESGLGDRYARLPRRCRARVREDALFRRDTKSRRTGRTAAHGSADWVD